MDLISPWLENWKIAVNAYKAKQSASTEATACANHKSNNTVKEIELDGEVLPWKTSVKYLDKAYNLTASQWNLESRWLTSSLKMKKCGFRDVSRQPTIKVRS